MKNYLKNFLTSLFAHKKSISGQAKARKPKVFVLDDDRFLREIIGKSLEGEGFEVALGEYGTDQDIIEKILAFDPDLISMDCTEPHITGLEFLEMLKVDKRTNHYKVVFLSNLTGIPSIVERAIKLGLVDWITKTDDLPDIVEKIAQIVNDFASYKPQYLDLLKNMGEETKNKPAPTSHIDVPVSVDGKDKVEWVDINKIDFHSTPIRHPELPEAIIKRITRFRQVIEEVYPISLEKTIDNFKRETHPEREVEIWEAIAEVYKNYVSIHPNLSIDEKKELSLILLDGSSAPERPGGFKLFDKKAVADITAFFEKTLSDIRSKNATAKLQKGEITFSMSTISADMKNKPDDAKSLTYEVWENKHPELVEGGQMLPFTPETLSSKQLDILIPFWKSLADKFNDPVLSFQGDIGKGVVRGYFLNYKEEKNETPANARGHIIKPIFDTNISPMTVGYTGQSLIYHASLNSPTLKEEIGKFNKLLVRFFAGEDIRKTLNHKLNPMRLEIVVSKEELYKYVFSQKITLILGDITRIQTDAIVNAANDTLLGGEGVDGAIHNAAGQELLKECETLGGCKTGEAKITKGYNLPAKFIIHTVGPVWLDGDGKETELLASCYKNSLNLAETHGIEAIAFPSISTGAFMMPIEIAAPVAIREVKTFLQTSKVIKEVIFVLFSQPDYELYAKLLSRDKNYI